MICNCCRHEFVVGADTLGRNLKCPNCSTLVMISNKEIICKCPDCKHKLAVELWMLGAVAPCPVCNKEIKLSLDAAESRKLFCNQETSAPKGNKLKTGDVIGKYKIESCLGVGGMGEVYLATHTILGTYCALKLLRNDDMIQEEDKLRLLREARLASSIHHQNLIAVLDADLDGKSGMIYIVMEYVDGVSIDQILENGPMQEERVLEIIRAAAEALRAAGELQIVHRDIKPANIMLSCSGNIKLADLGIAKIDSGTENTLTMENAILGTPAYASPEQLRSSHKVDARADIYSLGATMYHMLSGTMPFDGDSIFSIMAQVLEKTPPPLQSKVAVSPQTANLVQCMMAKDPAKRPANMQELIQKIDQVLQHRDAQEYVPELYNFKEQEKTHHFLHIRPAPTTNNQPGVPDRTPLRRYIWHGTCVLFLLLVIAFAIFTIMQNLSTNQSPYQQSISHTQFAFPKPAESGAVSPEHIQNLELFSLKSRTLTATNYAAKYPKWNNTQDSKIYHLTLSSYHTYQSESRLLQQALGGRQTRNDQDLKRRSGTLIPLGGSITDTMDQLGNPPEGNADAAGRAAFYKQVKKYVSSCEKQDNYRATPDAIELCNQLHLNLQKEDPLLLLQALLFYCKEKEYKNISSTALIQTLQDANPDFSYSKLPPEALEMPESFVVALLEKTWDEIDGVSYGKSNLIIELSRPASDRRYQVVSALLSRGCNVNIPDAQGRYPIHWVLMHDDTTFFSRLMQKKVNLQVSYEHMTLIEWGMKHAVPFSTLDKLLDYGAPLPNLPLEKVAPMYRRLWEKPSRQTNVKVITSHKTPPAKQPIVQTSRTKPVMPQQPVEQEKTVSVNTQQEQTDADKQAPSAAPLVLHPDASLGESRASDISGKYHPGNFTLPARFVRAQKKFWHLRNLSRGNRYNSFYSRAYITLEKTFHRLQRELQERNRGKMPELQKRSGTLMLNRDSLLSAVSVLDADKEGASYLDSLKLYARQNNRNNNFKSTQEALEIRKNWQKFYQTRDPLIFILALRVLHQDRNNFSPQMLKDLVTEGSPDFRYSKFPPEALELPGSVITALLAKCWDEVDGVSYGKSNLHLELSRSGNTARVEVVKALLESGCEVDLPDTQGKYPLHWAINDLGTMSELLKFAPNLRVRNEGRNIMDWGILHNTPVSVLKLLQLADIAPAPTINARTPQQYRMLFPDSSNLFQR